MSKSPHGEDYKKGVVQMFNKKAEQKEDQKNDKTTITILALAIKDVLEKITMLQQRLDSIESNIADIQARIFADNTAQAMPDTDIELLMLKHNNKISQEQAVEILEINRAEESFFNELQERTDSIKKALAVKKQYESDLYHGNLFGNLEKPPMPAQENYEKNTLYEYDKAEYITRQQKIERNTDLRREYLSAYRDKYLGDNKSPHGEDICI